MTDEQLAAIEAHADRADDITDWEIVCEEHIPTLIAEVQRLRKELHNAFCRANDAEEEQADAQLEAYGLRGRVAELEAQLREPRDAAYVAAYEAGKRAVHEDVRELLDVLRQYCVSSGAPGYVEWIDEVLGVTEGEA